MYLEMLFKSESDSNNRFLTRTYPEVRGKARPLNPLTLSKRPPAPFGADGVTVRPLPKPRVCRIPSPFRLSKRRRRPKALDDTAVESVLRRLCLGCGKSFKSSHAMNRLCRRCQRGSSYASAFEE